MQAINTETHTLAQKQSWPNETELLYASILRMIPNMNLGNRSPHLIVS